MLTNVDVGKFSLLFASKFSRPPQDRLKSFGNVVEVTKHKDHKDPILALNQGLYIGADICVQY